jgi:type I restriction enzyme S subunit
LDEQLEIGTFLYGQEAVFDSLADETSSSMALLQERRSALVSAAVTGQIDVRGLVPEADAA